MDSGSREFGKILLSIWKLGKSRKTRDYVISLMNQAEARKADVEEPPGSQQKSLCQARVRDGGRRRGVSRNHCELPFINLFSCLRIRKKKFEKHRKVQVEHLNPISSISPQCSFLWSASITQFCEAGITP